MDTSESAGAGDSEEVAQVLLLGTGVLAGLLLDMLARSGLRCKIVLAGRNYEKTYRRAMLAKLVASNLGIESAIEAATLDLTNRGQVVKTLLKYRPAIIVNATCLQSWWVVTRLPAEIAQEFNRACVGPWLPMHLALTWSLMKALSESGLESKVVNCSYPDAVNPILSRIGLAPTLGIGNVANTIPALHAASAEVLGIPPSEIRIRLVAHHYVSHRLPVAGDTAGAPFHFSVEHRGAELPVPVENILALLPSKFRRPGGLAGQGITASSAYRVIQALLSEKPVFLHAPGPLGMIGGYPLEVSRSELRLSLAHGLCAQRAEEINMRAQVFDGIEGIDANGTVHFTAGASRIMFEQLGVRCDPLKPDDALERARELDSRFREMLERRGLSYPVGLPE